MKKSLIPLLAAWLAAMPVCAETPLSASAAEELLAFVREPAGQLPTPVLLVLPFRNQNGTKSMEGELISERLIADLTLEPGLKIVERQNLDQALAEQKLALEGYISPESAAQAGRLTGAGAVLTASLIAMGENVEIHARLFAVESGEVEAGIGCFARHRLGPIGQAKAGFAQHRDVVGAIADRHDGTGWQACSVADFAQQTCLGSSVDDGADQAASQFAIPDFEDVGVSMVEAELLAQTFGEKGETA